MLRIFLTLYFIFLNTPALYADPCEALMEAPVILSPQGEGSQTEALITYLSRLLDETLIGDENLVRLVKGLERDEVVNPISEEEASSDFQLAVQRPGLEYLLQSQNLDYESLLDWAREKLSQRGAVREQREAVHEDTILTYHLMEFVTIQPGKFWMGEKKGEKVRVILTKFFEMGIFPVTQWQWAMVMGNNSSHFRNGPDSIEIKIRGRKIRMRPDHPVEQVSWSKAQRFIKRLNQFSKVDDPLIYKVVPDHIEGKIYRLPTEAEREYTARGGMQTRFYWGNNSNIANRYGWFQRNSNLSTHPVGKLLPNLFGLYDMSGNVWEWCSDWGRKYPKEKLIDPQGPDSGSFYVMRGGSWLDNEQNLRSGRRNFNPSHYRSNTIGFRLVREDAAIQE